jgi:hypothetical protein
MRRTTNGHFFVLPSEPPFVPSDAKKSFLPEYPAGNCVVLYIYSGCVYSKNNISGFWVQQGFLRIDTQ